ncbi:S9 family peptidase [Roseateles violae]|uniref:Prolyl oligopeptidase family serine peptidase n=1 Tax=Roseateles violae TaxID=3058042 RepID=A0ABT8E064_9BURK|nr:prolyl oligopeptidase family serine peptidase [Pelomonas sp. PFR6]MDN3923189.1 prolyl oligopeptidase family serine peptidase [Pelomonas sp. PFR6]
MTPPAALPADMSSTPAGARVRQLYEAWWQPGTEQLHGASELVALDGQIWFTGSAMPGALEAGPAKRVYRLDGEGRCDSLPAGTRLAQPSAPLRLLALVQARPGGGDAVELLSLDGTERRESWLAGGVVEQLRWSADGTQLLILVAGLSADVSGREGGHSMKSSAGPAWLPDVASPTGADRWRSLWIWAPERGAPRRITEAPFNPWEAAWCGPSDLLCVASHDHGEGSWYEAGLYRLGPASSEPVRIRQPAEQIGCPAGSADGEWMAWIEAVSSDRGLVCGRLHLQRAGAPALALDTEGVELTDIQWRDERRLLCTGLRGLETVVGNLDIGSGEFDIVWCSGTATLSGWQPVAIPCGRDGALAVVEAYATPPAIAWLERGSARPLLAMGPARPPDAGTIRPLRWQASDGLEIEGWLVEPTEAPAGPAPLFVDVHGGPIWAHRPRWAAGLRATPVLARQGYRVLLPNPRGSCGRGQDFARRVVGDMGGADADDLITGVQALVAQGLADPARVAISGTSYGGFLAAWLPTVCSTFQASIPISPVTNWYSQHFGSQVPWFASAFLRSAPGRADGPYHALSPLFHADRIQAPTLVLAGLRDKNAPASQALEFYNALVEARVPSELAMYPLASHSLRGFPDYLDSAARIVAWLECHL